MKSFIIPKELKKGEIIGMVSTARKITEELNFAINYIEKQGFRVVLGETITAENNQFAGNDDVRIRDFQRMLDNPQVKTIICVRGGYGTVRILDELDFSNFVKSPKWIVGYSDVTALHCHLHTLGVASLHGTMPINFKTNTEKALQSLFDVLTGKSVVYEWEDTLQTHKKQKIEGVLVGGNLSVIYSVLGSKSTINTDDKILLLEDLDEYLYHIDRMMINLKRNGLLSNLKALLVGGMTKMHDNEIPFGKSAEEIILEVTKAYDYPVVFNVPFGHINDNRAFILGGKATLFLEGRNCEIIQ